MADTTITKVPPASTGPGIVRGKTSALRRYGVVPGIPLVILVLVVLAAIFAPYLTPFDPIVNDLTKVQLPPSWVEGGNPDHLLGTDRLGRDVLTRMIFGARTSLVVVAFSLLIAGVLGGMAGIVAGYSGGWVDALISRLIDILLSMPTILLALAIAVALGPSLRNTILIIGFLSWPNIARLIRGEAIALRHTDFVVYSATIGVSKKRILTRHILSNVLPTLLVASTLEIANIIMAEASLSFLGAGVPPPTPSWGVMIDEGRALIATGWWIALFPGLILASTILSFNAVGDWLRDHLDPTTRQA